MRLRSILLIALTLAILSSCTKEEKGPEKKGEADVAYLSIKVKRELDTRGSGEKPGQNESDIISLYIFTFDNIGNIVGIPGTTDYFTAITTATSNPEAIKVSGKATRLLVIANPGPKMLTAINSVGSQSSLTLLNQAISGATLAELTDDTSGITTGFAMINSGDDTGLAAGAKITDPLVDISGKIKKLGDYSSEAAAKVAAETDRVHVTIERLSSKLELKVKSSVTVPQDAKFTFDNWTLDAVNSTFYPFAEKTILEVSHTVGEYISNFYTRDPNFSNKTGIVYASVNSQYNPVLVAPYSWMNDEDITYCIENTMEADQQKFGNATRLVIKGKYYPKDTWSKDWFSFAGISYETLSDLQTAYGLGGTNLTEACDDMFDKIKAYADKNTITLAGTDFESLTVADLEKIPNGGEVIKTDKQKSCIRWYQDGLAYYYYEIRHDDQTTIDMAFGKYGVVRNNWYSLTLAKVTGPGTPWYPDIQNPGPGDPDPVDPIDESVGFVGVEVEVMPWIIWEREIEI